MNTYQPLTRNGRLFSLLLLFVLCGCQNDDSPATKTTAATPEVTQTINFSEFQKNAGALTAYNNCIGKPTKAVGKLMHNALYGFTIDTDAILLTKRDKYNFYTFTLYPDEDHGYVERLYLHPQSNGTYLAFKVQYALTDGEKQDIMNGKPITPDLHNKTLYTPLTNFDTRDITKSSGFGSFITICTYHVVTIENPVKYDDDHSGDLDGTNGTYEPTYTYIYELVGCNFLYSNVFAFVDGGMGNGGGGGTIGSGPRRNDPFNPDDSITGVPPLFTIKIDPETKRLNHLKNLITDKRTGLKTNVKKRIDALNIARTTQYKENGALFDMSQNILEPSARGSNFCNWYDYPLEYFIKLHMHEDKYYRGDGNGQMVLVPTPAVESDTDIFSFLQLYGAAKEQSIPDSDLATDLFVSRAGTFAMMIEDPAKAMAAYEKLTASQSAFLENKESNQAKEIKEFIRHYDENVQDIFDNNNDDVQGLLDAFITFIKEHKVNNKTMGICIYQAVYDENGNIINWTKL